MQGCPTGSTRPQNSDDVCVYRDGGSLREAYGKHHMIRLSEYIHSNVLELYIVLLALRHFRLFLQGQHVLVRSDHMSTVVYINHQGGTCSCQLHSGYLLSLSATHVPVRLNPGVESPTKRVANSSRRCWRCGNVTAELPSICVTLQDNTHCCLLFVMRDHKTPLGVYPLAHKWPCDLCELFLPWP